MSEVKDLNQLSDAELSECFAVEVAGWKKPKMKNAQYGGTNYDYFWWDPAGACRDQPSFATDANAVLPWLEKVTGGHYSVWYSHRLHSDTPHNYTVDLLQMPECIGHGTTFPRAACCALIAAKRAAKEATP